MNIAWYWLIGAIFSGYAVLDGFDLGVGALHLLSRTDEERRTLLNAIGPLWDGNEVWLVVGGGTLFAAFPVVYATVFSGFYIPLVVLLLALIFRAASLEFRSRRRERWWSRTWDVAFWAASVLASLLFGIALGNVLRGIPLDPDGNYVGSLAGLLNPYALLTGLTTLVLFVMHGAVFLALRTEGAVQARARNWARVALLLLVVALLLLGAYTLLALVQISARLRSSPWLLLFPAAAALALTGVWAALRRGRDWTAFLASSAALVSLLALAGASMFPVLVFATDPALNLTAFNAASTPASLRIMLIIAGIGLPLALVYFFVLYRVFSGKVRLTTRSY